MGAGAAAGLGRPHVRHRRPRTARADLAEAIAALPRVQGASWTTESTLRVAVDDDDYDPRAELCPLLEADPDLRASRVQLQAPAGSTRPVRFLQCRAY